ncbi:hypothetical protein SAMD00024442_6_16 [Candidatus Symbiothrix dinenymphae]|nr:hypothetical protein SAMD00024442_6_16 [Candidatus Symbiothrix dinenymphae]
MKKSNKIIVAVSPDRSQRIAMVQRIAVNLGFAKTQGDAGKIIRQTPYDFDLSNCYFVLAETYNLHESPMTTQRLYELAAIGIAVIIGAKRIPPEMEFFCDVYTPQNFHKI